MRSRLPVRYIVPVLLLVLAVVTAPTWLALSGRLLVADHPPRPAAAIVVLAGDARGNRMLKACELVAAGYAPYALVSGPMDVYGVNEAELAIDFAVRAGCPAERLVPFRAQALSTEEEAANFKPELQRRGVRKLLLVTSNYHTARSRRVFQSTLGSDVEIMSVAAPDKYFSPGEWWRNREGRKIAFVEWSKTVAYALGL